MNKFISAKATHILFVLFVMLISGTTAFAQELPKIAVYATGNVGSDEKTALGTRMLSSLIRSGRYRAIERSSAFLAKLDEELVRQHSGAIDDNQISALGKQYGVDFICIADITPAFGEFQVSARIINVETAEVVFIGDASGQLKTMSDLERLSNRVVGNMLTSQNNSESFTMNGDFTVGQRWATFGLNLVLPGSGSAVIMKDWIGATVSWSSSVVGAVIGVIYIGDSKSDTLAYPAIGLLTGHTLSAIIWNPIRTFSYHRPGSPKSKRPARSASASIITRDAFNFAAFPDRNGNWQASALYMAEF